MDIQTIADSPGNMFTEFPAGLLGLRPKTQVQTE